MCIYLVISFSCCCYLFLSFYMCSPFLSLLYVSICFHLSEWVTSGSIDQSDQSRWKPPFWGVREECGCPHLQWAQCISANCSIYDFQFQWQGRGRRSVRRGGRRLTPLALPVPYTPHLGIASIKTGPKHASIWRGPKMPQSKRGKKQPETMKSLPFGTYSGADWDFYRYLHQNAELLEIMRKHDNPISGGPAMGNWVERTLIYLIGFNTYYHKYWMTNVFHTYQCISTQFKITFVNFGTKEANRAFFGTFLGHWSRSTKSRNRDLKESTENCYNL